MRGKQMLYWLECVDVRCVFNRFSSSCSSNRCSPHSSWTSFRRLFTKKTVHDVYATFRSVLHAFKELDNNNPLRNGRTQRSRSLVVMSTKGKAQAALFDTWRLIAISRLDIGYSMAFTSEIPAYIWSLLSYNQTIKLKFSWQSTGTKDAYWYSSSFCFCRKM